MQQTIEPTLEIVTQAKSQFEQINGRLLHLLTFVPDDKLSWAPSSTSKSALRVVAHSALVSRFFADTITGKREDNTQTLEEFFSGLFEEEHQYSTRESVVALANKTGAELCQALDTVNASNIDSMRNSPFGPRPMSFWISANRNHMGGHVGQLEYLQTIWGDTDFHFA